MIKSPLRPPGWGGSLGSTIPAQIQVRRTVQDAHIKYPGLDESRNVWIHTEPHSLGEGCCYDPGRLPGGSTCGRVHLKYHRPDIKGQRGFMQHWPGGDPLEDGDGDPEPPPFIRDAVSWHPAWIPHRKRHRDRLPWSQADPAADSHEGGVPMWADAALDQGRCLNILAAYGVGPQVLNLLRRYWDCLTMVAWDGGYLGRPLKAL